MEHHPRVHTTPYNIEAEAGEVVIDGENGLIGTLSPEMAMELSGRLAKASARAADQARSQGHA